MAATLQDVNTANEAFLRTPSVISNHGETGDRVFALPFRPQREQSGLNTPRPEPSDPLPLLEKVISGVSPAAPTAKSEEDNTHLAQHAEEMQAKAAYDLFSLAHPRLPKRYRDEIDEPSSKKKRRELESPYGRRLPSPSVVSTTYHTAGSEAYYSAASEVSSNLGTSKLCRKLKFDFEDQTYVKMDARSKIYDSSAESYATRLTIYRDGFKGNDFTHLLHTKKLWPVDPDWELDWSGRGQHAEFGKGERPVIDKILQVDEVLGSTNSAVVESVRCKRILLARKTIRCNRQMTQSKAIDEVAHLNRLDHSHIVRVIGTYTMGQNLSILIYPVAQWNLETFLQEVALGTGSDTLDAQVASLQRFILCLSNALAYLHRTIIKHMDIKPKNILLRHLPKENQPGLQYKVYIADFGIARSYTTLEATETDGTTMFTRKYAAPEVVDCDKRGLPADVFSLGCVFAEVITALAGKADYPVAPPVSGNNPAMRDDRFSTEIDKVLSENEDGDTSYQANIDAVKGLLDTYASRRVERGLTWDFPLLEREKIKLEQYTEPTKHMIDSDPAQRPTASKLFRRWGTAACCWMGAEPLEAHVADCSHICDLL